MHSDKCLKMICIKIQDPKPVQNFVIAYFIQALFLVLVLKLELSIMFACYEAHYELSTRLTLAYCQGRG